VGDLSFYGRTYQRYRAFLDLGYNLIPVSFTPLGYCPGLSNSYVKFVPSIVLKFFYKIGYPLDIFQINEKILEILHFFEVNIIWCEKPLMLKPKTLKIIKKKYPRVKIAFYSEDDMFAKHNQSKYFVKCLPYYDVVFTTKSYNCHPKELPSLGAKKVIFVDKAFCKYTHRPLPLSEEERKKWGADVGFVGTFEEDRAEKMLFLAENGVKVRIWGNGWKRWIRKHPNLLVEGRPVYGIDYVKVLNATKINLCFLRKANRDLQTARTMEIPACGAFMLAERTEEHLRLFEEGKEAEFFDVDNPKELLEKVKYYLTHEEERKKIAKAGRERCLKSGYSHHDRLKYMMSFLKA
jgi:spore maturation protein CgeB